MELANSAFKKVVMTKRVADNDLEAIVSETPSRRSQLARGVFISHPSTIEEGYVLHGGISEELMNTKVVSVATPALIVTVLLEGRLSFGYDDLCFDLSVTNQSQAIAVNLTKPASFRRDIIKQSTLKKINILFSHQWLQSRLGSGSCALNQFLNTHKAHIDVHYSEELDRIVRSLIEPRQNNNFNDTISRDIATLQLVKIVTDEIERRLPISNLSQQKRPDSVAQLIKHIEYNLDQDLGLEELARSMAMSVSKLQRKFKNQIGMTVISYVRARKLERAKQSIEQSGLSISEAAYEAGYHHPSNFTLAFRKHFGHCPSKLIVEEIE
ncbi:AraC family transcriptional regulator [Vibrio mediterranei]|uniref:helix-turn-helix domain-containing protein n=1 Tax=Vibrio mediterranei TaxID=689 RepID=UPI00148C00F6|nr:AraC family transcriptional regulator [Vibrio mediterranei]